TESYGVSVFQNLGKGDGTFGAAQTYTLVGSANSVAIADFNKDGKLDIATAGAEMDVLLNKGDNTFGAAQKVGPAGNHLGVADINGDGFVDLAQIHTTEIPGVYGIDLVINLGDGQGPVATKRHK